MVESPQQEVRITYEKLFELLHIEKQREDIQKLDATFYDDVLHYLKEKKHILTQRERDASLMEAEDVRKLRIQMENILRIIRELYERRERKILTLALHHVKSSVNVDSSVLLAQEQIFYERLVHLLTDQRSSVLQRLLHLNRSVEVALPPVVASQHTQHTSSQDVRSVSSAHVPSPSQESTTPTPSVVLSALVTLRLLAPLPRFVGPSLEQYGPFATDDIVSLPRKIAELLIRKEKAEEIHHVLHSTSTVT